MTSLGSVLYSFFEDHLKVQKYVVVKALCHSWSERHKTGLGELGVPDDKEAVLEVDVVTAEPTNFPDPESKPIK